jgi:hypothetical protein
MKKNSGFKSHNKSFWNRAERNKSPEPYVTSISAICELCGQQQYIQQMRNRVRQKLESDPMAFGNCILTGGDDGNEIFLTAAGLELSRDIIIGYIGAEKYTQMRDLMLAKDEFVATLKEQQEALRAVSTSLLKQLLIEYGESGTMHGLKAVETTHEAVAQEYRRRNPFAKLGK